MTLPRENPGKPRVRVDDGYNYSYYAAPVYPPEVTFGFGAAPGYVAPGYYAPGYYGYAPPAYVAPPYIGWNNAGWGYW